MLFGSQSPQKWSKLLSSILVFAHNQDLSFIVQVSPDNKLFSHPNCFSIAIKNNLSFFQFFWAGVVIEAFPSGGFRVIRLSLPERFKWGKKLKANCASGIYKQSLLANFFVSLQSSHKIGGYLAVAVVRSYLCKLIIYGSFEACGLFNSMRRLVVRHTPSLQLTLWNQLLYPIMSQGTSYCPS